MDETKIKAVNEVVDEALNEDTENPEYKYLLLVTKVKDDGTGGFGVCTGNVDNEDVLDMILLQALHIARAMAQGQSIRDDPVAGNA